MPSFIYDETVLRMQLLCLAPAAFAKSEVYESMSIKSLQFSNKTIRPTDIYTGVDGEDADENGRQQQANDCN